MQTLERTEELAADVPDAKRRGAGAAWPPQSWAGS